MRVHAAVKSKVLLIWWVRQPDVPYIQVERVRQIALSAQRRKRNTTITGHLSEAAANWARLWGVPELLAGITFRRNERLRSTIARWLLNEHCVELSPRFFALRRRQEEILCHELAHAAAVVNYGRRVEAHGPAWRALVHAAGFEPSVRFRSSRRRGAQPRRTTHRPQLFEHRCLVCHAVRFAGKPNNRWRCVECLCNGLAGRLRISVRSLKGATR